MIYLLFVILILMTFNAYLITGRDILSPFLIVCSMFVFSTFFAVIMAPTWDLKLSAITILVIIIGLIMFGAGECSVRWAISERVKFRSDFNNHLEVRNQEIKISLLKTLFVSVGLVIFIIIYFQRIYEISLLAGNSEGYLGMIKYARILMIQQGMSTGFLLDQIFKVVGCIAYIYIFAILYNKIYIGKKRINAYYFIPVFIYLCIAFLSTSRTYFTQIAIFALLVGFLFYYKKNLKISIKNKKIIKFGVVGIFAFITLFSILGYATDKTQNLGVINGVSYYIGGSIPALDNYLNNPPNNTGYFGSETLYVFYNTANRLGFDVPTFPLALKSIPGENITSNVFTALRRYIQDYGFLGMIFIQFMLGVIYSLAYLSVKNSKKTGLSIIIYSALFYPVIEIAIEERFFSDILSITTIIKVLSLYFFYKILVRFPNKNSVDTMSVTRKS